MPYFNIVAETSENTVVTEYEPVKKRSDSYQSEVALEQEFIRLLCEQGYEYLPIHTEKDLIANLRKKLEELNNYQFSDTEWDDFFKNAVANPNEHIVEKTRKIQEDNVQVLTRDDGSSKNITLIDKKNIHNNRLQVINQYAISTDNGAKHNNRYDVTVLVNGLPLVHIELKRRGVSIREAFNQINRYQRDSFWAGSGLYEYIQIFVISNGTNTKYYSNSTRNNAIKGAEMLAEERPDHKLKIQIIDSHTYSMPYGWYFCECARKVRNGGELAACVAELKQKLDCVEICLAAYSLKQMKKSGRVSAAAAVVGDLLGIRPIISLNAGVSKVESKVRGDAAVPAAMIKWVESRVDSMKDTPYMVAYTSSTAKRDELVKLCKKAFGHAPLIVFQLGGVVSANTGPDGIAIVYEGKPRNLEAYAPELP